MNIIHNKEICLAEFDKFYNLITQIENYTPWFFPVAQEGKNPDGIMVSKKYKPDVNKPENEKLKYSWKAPHARCNKEECIWLIKNGFNIGIAARKDDPLVIIDIDDLKYVGQMPKNSLINNSRRRYGKHGFFLKGEDKIKINIPGEFGECRSNDMYVLSPGSYIPFTDEELNEKLQKGDITQEEYNKLKQDSLRGYYTVLEEKKPRYIMYDELPEFFKEQDRKNNLVIIKPEDKKPEQPIILSDGKHSALFDLKMNDIVTTQPGRREPSPIHDSETGQNFSISKDGSICHCWRHNCSLNVIQFLCVKSGYCQCQDAGTPHQGEGVSKIKGDYGAILHAWIQAKKDNFIPEDDSVPIKAMQHIAFQEKLIIKENEFLNDDIYNKVIEIITTKYQLNPGRQIKERPEIELPATAQSKTERTIGDFADELGLAIAHKNKLFFKPEIKAVVEIRNFKHVNESDNEVVEYLGFSELSPTRFVTLIEEMACLYKTVKVDDDYEDMERNMTKDIANFTLNSDQFISKLPIIKRILTIPIPILRNNKLIIPDEKYDRRFETWLNPNNLKIKEIPIEEAKDWIEKIFKEFCFEKDDNGNLTEIGKQSKTHAIAGLLTPFLRGLYSKFNIRTPLFFYLANRSRAGKDYCAGLAGYIYEGVNIEDMPIATNDRNTSSNEELRKKILSTMLKGRRRMHFSNNIGKIHNAVLENILTSVTFSDRLLGKNEISTFDNEMEFSLSGNTGIQYSNDLINRTRFIYFLLDIEDPNSRKFENDKLHLWVLDNREKILSALYTLIKTWFDAGMPLGKTPFTSFPEWAAICGGIMTYHGFGDPCMPDNNEAAKEGDKENNDMKKLFELIYEKIGESEFTKKDIFKWMEDSMEEESEAWQITYNIFQDIDFTKTGGKSQFSRIFYHFVNRIFSGLKLKLPKKTKDSRFEKYILENTNYKITI